jgi:hypothetical protein
MVSEMVANKSMVSEMVAKKSMVSEIRNRFQINFFSKYK